MKNIVTSLILAVTSLAWAQAPEMTGAEVRKIDAETGKITLRHGPIKNLDMPAMTMVFTLKDPALAGKFKAGDQVLFTADKILGAYTVTHLEAKP
ncbi:MAG: hypothetical protein RLZZ401_1294 [Pseudomonadota bacterium]|jgi:Cu/Ag efflux protein CusF